jgi:hypothetical protein
MMLSGNLYVSFAVFNAIQGKHYPHTLMSVIKAKNRIPKIESLNLEVGAFIGETCDCSLKE